MSDQAIRRHLVIITANEPLGDVTSRNPSAADRPIFAILV